MAFSSWPGGGRGGRKLKMGSVFCSPIILGTGIRQTGGGRAVEVRKKKKGVR